MCDRISDTGQLGAEGGEEKPFAWISEMACRERWVHLDPLSCLHSARWAQVPASFCTATQLLFISVDDFLAANTTQGIYDVIFMLYHIGKLTRGLKYVPLSLEWPMPCSCFNKL